MYQQYEILLFSLLNKTNFNYAKTASSLYNRKGKKSFKQIYIYIVDKYKYALRSDNRIEA